MPPPYDLARIRSRILAFRDGIANETNPLRTDFYLRYYRRNPEVPWVFMAHLVSRNAGYQMSDTMRIAMLDELWGPPGWGDTDLRKKFSYMSCLWAVLEAANFLIGRDVIPQLRTYEEAKTYPEHADELFDMLLDPTTFAADPFPVAEWKRFFRAYQAAKDNGTLDAFVHDLSPGSAIQRHTFAQVINEQNQIQDRLVDDPEAHYLREFGSGQGGPISNVFLFLADWYGSTYLCFPKPMIGGDPATADKLILYQVHGFMYLISRIQTGRELYANLFLDAARLGLIYRWTVAHPHHRGTRVDYNPTNYRLDPSIRPFSGRYSPPLVETGDQLPVWYGSAPRQTLWYRNLQSTPVPLPQTIAQRASRDPVFQPDVYLRPFDMRDSTQTVIEVELSELREIAV
jgi:Protein of unknown function (DUF2515)